jgi:hypothetical protein
MINLIIAALRMILNSDPTTRGWVKLCEEVAKCEDLVVLDYVCDHLRTERESWAKVALGLPAQWFGKTVHEEPRLSIWEALGSPEVKERLVPTKLTPEGVSWSFWIQTTPVTQDLYQEVMGTNPSSFEGEKQPVENVSWWDALHFCNALSELEGLEPCYVFEGEEEVRWEKGANGYRLPTEAEWEYACRAETKTDTPLGDITSDQSECPVLDKQAWYGHNAGHYGPHEVGLKEANPWGLYGMLGNVFEWCWDWGDEAQTQRSQRGGCWSTTPDMTTSSSRNWGPPDGAHWDCVGIRVCRGC